jgi:hypothetical protein
MRAAISREVQVGAGRFVAQEGRRVVATHRLQPARLTGGATRNRARAAILGGVLLEQSRVGPYQRVVDALLTASGSVAPDRTVNVGSGGSVIVRATGAEGGVIVRVGITGGTSDPAAAVDGLRLLAGHQLPVVPRLLGAGDVEGMAWTTETALPGRRPRRVTSALTAAVADFLEQLPRAGRSASSLGQDLTRIASVVPSRTAMLDRLAAGVDRVLQTLPGMMRHGDLWAGNLLVEGARLTGVIDWDAWHPCAVPGTDLLQLLVTQERHHRRLPLGEAWAEKPWRHGHVSEELRSHLRRMGIQTPSEAVLEVVGLAWWAGEVAGTLTRTPGLAADGSWVARNIDVVA